MMEGTVKKHPIALTVNGRAVEALTDGRQSLADFLRQELRLTGTHLGCEHGVCGACNVLVDGRTVRSCLMLAVQASGCDVRTVDGLAAADGGLSVLQQAFIDNHGMQCGFCTPGMLMTAWALLQENQDPSEDEIRSAMSGNLCRCTGYQDIVASITDAARRMRAESARS